MKRRAFVLVSSLLMLGLVPGPALASRTTVDQSQTNVSSSIGTVSPIFAQTFTAGLYGPLQTVDLYMTGQPSTVTVSLQGVTGSPPVPDGHILAQRIQSVNVSQRWVEFAFATAPIVIPGHVYSIFIYLQGSLNSMWGSPTNRYPRGQALWFKNGAWRPLQSVATSGPADFAFKTNVGPALPTPTPTHRPTPTRAPTPTPTATPTPTEVTVATPTDTAAIVLSSTPSASVPATASASSTSGGPAGSGGSGDPIPPAVGAGAGLLALLAGGLAFLLWRRRRESSGA